MSLSDFTNGLEELVLFNMRKINIKCHQYLLMLLTVKNNTK